MALEKQLEFEFMEDVRIVEKKTRQKKKLKSFLGGAAGAVLMGGYFVATVGGLYLYDNPEVHESVKNYFFNLF